MRKVEPLKESGSGCLARLEVTPGSRKTEVTGANPWRSAIGIRVAAPQQGGLANEELMSFLAAMLGVSKGSLKLVRGERSRLKVVFLPVTVDEAMSLLGVG